MAPGIGSAAPRRRATEPEEGAGARQRRAGTGEERAGAAGERSGIDPTAGATGGQRLATDRRTDADGRAADRDATESQPESDGAGRGRGDTRDRVAAAVGSLAVVAGLTGTAALVLTAAYALAATVSFEAALPLAAAGREAGLVIALVGLAAAGDDDDVDRLVEGVRELAAGNHDVEFDVDREDGLGELADELDDLADGLAEREREHEEYVAYTDDVLDAVDDVFYVLDREGRHHRWNRTFCEVTGYDDEAVAEMHPLEFVADEDEDAAASAIDEAFETGDARVEATLETSDGDHVPHEFAAARVDAPDGTPVIVGVGRDVTHRKRYEERFAAVGESVRRLARAETESEIAETVCSIVGEELAEPLCMLWLYDEEADELVPAAGTDEAAEIVEEATGGEPPVLPADGPEMDVFRQGEPTVVEDYGALADATYPDAPLGTILKVPVGDAGLLAVGYREVTDVDPTTHELVEILARNAAASLERVEREQRLARYKEFTDDVMDAIDDVFYVVDEAGEHRRWNDAFCDVTGYADDEVAEMRPWEFFEGEDRERVEAAIEEAFETGETKVEASFATKDGDEVAYEFVASLLEAPDETPVVVGIGRDVSERRAAEREREQSERFRQELYEITSDATLDSEAKVRRLLDLGRERLDVECGLVTRIDEETGHYEVLWAEGTDFVEEGVTTDLSTTYCREVVSSRDILALADTTDYRLARPGEGHEEWGIECYIGGRIEVGGETHGTLCFVDPEPRSESFSAMEKTSVDLMTRWISQEFERQEYTEELRRKDRAMEAAPVGVTVADATQPDNPIVYANDEFEALTGYGPEEYLGRNCRFLQGEETDPEPVQRMRDAIEAEEPVTVELRNYRADGSEFWNRVSVAPVTGEDGTVTEFIGFQQDVTERKRSEHELREREQELSRLLRNIPGLVYRTRNDPTWPTDFVSEGVRDITGYDPETLEEGDLSWGEDVMVGERDAVWERVQAALDERESFRVTYPIETADGERRWVDEQGVGVFDEDGELSFVEGVVVDVTDRVEYERELEARSAALEDSIDGIAILDDDEQIVFANEAYAEIYGNDDSEALVGESWLTCYAEDERKRIESEVMFELAETGSWRGEAEGLRDDGSTFPQELSLTMLDDGRVVCVVRDVTDRKERRRELEETNARLGAIIEASPAALVAIDLDGTVQLWNPAAERIFGWSEEEVVGEHLPFVPDRKREEYESLADRVAAGEVVTNVESSRVRADGTEVDVNVSLAPLRGPDGEVTGVMGALLDISEQKEYEEELERTTELLEQAQRVADVGGWELDLRQDPPEMTWADQLYDMHGVDPDTELDLETALEYYHPDDRDRIRRTVERAIEEGEPYDMEARLQPNGEQQRWIRALARPVWEGDRVVALRGSIQDITDHKRREAELQRTRDLLQQAQRMGGVGGWELDVSERPYEGIWTDQLFEIFETEPRPGFTLDDLFEFVHPRERNWVRAEITRGIESGEPFSLEHRVLTAEDDERWVRVVAEPVEAGEDRYRGAILDVTAQKEREVILESLHETARGLLQTQTAAEVAELAMQTAGDVLDAPCSAVYLLDDDTGRLEPVAFTEAFDERCGGPNASTSSEGSTLLWEAYVSEAATTLSESAVDEPGIFEAEVREAVYVPIGDHGVFVVASPEGPIDPDTRRVAETLVATMEAALHRLDSENDLRERESELEARNRRLRRQIQINEIIRTVDQSLIGASSREEIETAVCERLTEAPDVAFAWIGTLDATEGSVVPRAWAGTSHDYLDAISLQTGRTAVDPAVQTATTGDGTVVESVVQEVKTEEWRKHALVSNFSSAVAVPIELDEYTYGVLGVYGTEPEQFGDLERDVFDELGESIANSINAVETRQALYADTFVELTIRLGESEDFLARVASETGGSVEYVGLGTHSEEQSRVFFQVSGPDADDVEAMLESTVSVGEFRRIGDGGEGHLFEATVAGEVLAADLVRRGGVPRAMSATPEDLEVTVDVPASINVREFVETLRDHHPSAELVSRHDVERDVETRQELVSSLFDDLTDRQVEVLRTAYFAGFFDWPRESTGEDIAELLEVSQPTVNRHVRHGLDRLLAQLFEEEPATIAGAQ